MFVIHNVPPYQPISSMSSSKSSQASRWSSSLSRLNSFCFRSKSLRSFLDIPPTRLLYCDSEILTSLSFSLFPKTYFVPPFYESICSSTHKLLFPSLLMIELSHSTYPIKRTVHRVNIHVVFRCFVAIKRRAASHLRSYPSDQNSLFS